MRKVLCVAAVVFFSIVCVIFSVFSAAFASEKIVLTMGSWRFEDIEQMNRIISKFHDKYPDINIKYDPSAPEEYNKIIKAQMQEGTGPDILYLRSYAVSRQLFNEGYLNILDDLPGLNQNFTSAMRAPWATEDGRPYGVPFVATAHGVYYNMDIFKKLNLKIPNTWEELLSTGKIIKEAGFIPFANASGDKWTIAEIVFMNIAPNFIGGRDGRMEYLAGKRPFNDANMVSLFQAIKDIAPFLPDNQAFMTYSDSQQLFLQGKAAMWLGGSWDIPFFEEQKPAFQWSVFAVPPPSGRKACMTFQLDAGMGLNSASKHKDEARLFLEWMTGNEFAEMMGNELPGFFPMHTNPPTLRNPHANAFLELKSGSDTDVRFAWEKLMDGTPSGYDLIQNAAIDVIAGKITPQEAADRLQSGLAEWFEPAKESEKK